LSIPGIQDEPTKDYEVAARLAGEFFVRGVEIIARAHDGDLLKGIIFTAVAVASKGGSAAADEQAPRPVSVMSVASSLGVPYETTRRYVNLLVSQGLCERIGRSGVVVRPEGLATPAMLTALKETVTSFNRLATALRRMDRGAGKA
jgi:hypothetical protein